jgi:hypothetical protein
MSDHSPDLARHDGFASSLADCGPNQ